MLAQFGLLLGLLGLFFASPIVLILAIALEGGFTQGRPLRLGGRRLWLRPRRRGTKGGPRDLRNWVLQRIWRKNAGYEQASVLAFEQLADGRLGEAYAAAVLAAGARQSRDPEVSRTLKQIARDEAGHAALSWRILSWLIDQGGPTVRRAVTRRAQHLEPHAPRTRATFSYLLDLRAGGMISRQHERALYRHVRQALLRRLAAQT